MVFTKLYLHTLAEMKIQFVDIYASFCFIMLDLCAVLKCDVPISVSKSPWHAWNLNNHPAMFSAVVRKNNK